MKRWLLLLLMLFVAGCASSGGAHKAELDMQQLNPVASMPPPFDTEPASGDGDVLLAVVNGRGSQALSFSAVLTSGDFSYEVWKDAPINAGFDETTGDDEALVRNSSRLCIVRLPIGQYDLVVTSGDEVRRHRFMITHEELTNRTVYFTKLGILIAEISDENAD